MKVQIVKIRNELKNSKKVEKLSTFKTLERVVWSWER